MVFFTATQAFGAEEQEKKQKPVLPRVERTLAAGLLTAGFCWAAQSLWQEVQVDDTTGAVKGDDYRKFTTTLRNRIAFVAAAYLTLRCGYYTLMSAKKLLFKGN